MESGALGKWILISWLCCDWEAMVKLLLESCSVDRMLECLFFQLKSPFPSLWLHSLSSPSQGHPRLFVAQSGLCPLSWIRTIPGVEPDLTRYTQDAPEHGEIPACPFVPLAGPQGAGNHTLTLLLSAGEQGHLAPIALCGFFP